MWMLEAAMDGDSSGIHSKVLTVPHVTIRTIVDGREETLSEYLCDWPDCPNVAVNVIGVVRELRIRTAMCPEHTTRFRDQENKDSQRY